MTDTIVLIPLTEQRIEQLQARYREHSRIEGTTSCTALGCRDRWPCWHRLDAQAQLIGAGIEPR